LGGGEHPTSPPLGEARMKKEINKIVNILAEIKAITLGRYLTVISTL